MRFLRRLVSRLILLGVLAAPFLVAAAVLEPEPSAPPAGSPTGRDARAVEALIDDVRRITNGTGRGVVEVTREDLIAALRLAGRAFPGARGNAVIDGRGVTVDLSLPVPIEGAGWLNLHAKAPPSRDGLRIENARVGGLHIPPALVLPLLRLSLDLGTGTDAGAIATRAIAGLVTAGGSARVTIVMDRAERDRLRDAARDGLMGTRRASAEDIGHYLDHLSEAADARRLGTDLAPWLRLAVEEAARRAEGGNPAREIEAALLALGLDCGSRSLASVIGDVPPESRVRSQCARVRLAGRTDLRQHFTLSAALRAAGRSGTAFAIGEFKELLDSRGGTGFSFDDILADRAGIRFAERLMAAKPAAWPSLATRLTTGDAALMPDARGLPSGMSEAAFRRTVGEVGSPAYRDLIAEVDRRLDAAPFFAE
mgnify:CR=1 FL=1